MSIRIACLIEGQGEIEAIQVLVRRIAALHDPSVSISFPKILRIKRSHVTGSRELERTVELAARRLAGTGGLLALFDADNDCPARLGPQIQNEIRRLRPNIPSATVLANREFETWFLFAAESLAGVRGLPSELKPPEHPEAIRDAKGWLSRNMVGARAYRPTVDQAALAARMDIEAARQSDSFDKFCREVNRLLVELRSRDEG